MSADEHHHRRLHFARIRRAKFWLRFMPRRARFHTYPVIGRFASFARQRSYLWSFRYSSLRPSFYVGMIWSLMPAVGVQLPLAFVLCLIFRTNFMVMGGLQFITNPVTLLVVYPATYKVGEFALHHTGWGPAESVPAVPAPPENQNWLPPEEAAPPQSDNWFATLAARLGVSNLTHLFNSLVVGGVIVGVVSAAIIDLLWRWLVLPAAKLHQARKKITAIVTPHPDDNTPSPPDSTS